LEVLPFAHVLHVVAEAQVLQFASHGSAHDPAFVAVKWVPGLVESQDTHVPSADFWYLGLQPTLSHLGPAPLHVLQLAVHAVHTPALG